MSNSHLLLGWVVLGLNLLLPAWTEGAPVSAHAPPAGIAIDPAEREELTQGASALAAEITSLRAVLADKPSSLALLPDVEIFHKAVQWALAYDEFHRSNEVTQAQGLLDRGLKRARQLRAGQAPWLTATGLVVRGYRSKIDGSVQPYGLVVPAAFQPSSLQPMRLDVWLHGRDNHLTELKFLGDRLRSPGEFAPTNAFVLHPYGRYCNAFKFAGETDVLEALEHVRRSYPIDPARMAVRGFSMGGAGCWHLAAHHPALWAAAAPGAGFAETAEYTKALAKDPKPPLFEQKLWRLYDATEYAANLFHVPTLAYHGELDEQKQAADMMERALKAEGLALERFVGPGTEHKYEPATKAALARRFDTLMAVGRDPAPRKIRFTTWTLRYSRASWLAVDGLEEHWRRARVEAEIVDANTVVMKTENVTRLHLEPPPTGWPLNARGPVQVRLDGEEVRAKFSDERLPGARFEKRGGRWRAVDPAAPHPSGLEKRPGLQGPIDDAFLDSFLMVRPTGRAWHAATAKWVASELAHATNEWRGQFRGDARVQDDTAVTAADIAAHHLVLWGDAQSNRLLARLADKLPARWSGGRLVLGTNSFPAEHHLPALIFPNPLNPRRYVVLNTGFTFAEFAPASNAQQTPKLPDYAVVDIRVPRAARLSSGLALAGFFDEQWRLPLPR